jgi:hypothetical protein
MQKTYLFSLQIGMPQANALNSVGYTDTVPFLTVGKLDIYLLKSLGKWATVLIRVTNNYRNWLPTYLIFSAIEIRGLPISGDCTFIALPRKRKRKSTVSVYPLDFRCINKQHTYLQRK